MADDTLPNAASAYVEVSKITDYLLNSSHSKGKAKAKFFLGVGFAPTAIDVFRSSLVAHGQQNKVVGVRSSPYGKLFQVACNFSTPDQANPCINTVWQLDGVDAAPRLVTAYPES